MDITSITARPGSARKAIAVNAQNLTSERRNAVRLLMIQSLGYRGEALGL